MSNFLFIYLLLFGLEYGGTDVLVDLGLGGSRDAEVAFGREPEGRGAIQSPHKCIWLIEGASDPQWCTAGAPLIGEGGEQ